MLSHKIQLFWLNAFFLYLPMYKIDIITLWPHPTPMDHDLNAIVSIYYYVTSSPPTVALPYPGDMNWKNIEFILPEKNASTQIWAFRLNGLWEEHFWKILTILNNSKFSPFTEGVPLHLNNLNPPHPMMLCAKFGSNRPSGYGEDEIANKFITTMTTMTMTTENGQI